MPNSIRKSVRFLKPGCMLFPPRRKAMRIQRSGCLICSAWFRSGSGPGIKPESALQNLHDKDLVTPLPFCLFHGYAKALLELRRKADAIATAVELSIPLPDVAPDEET